MIDKSTLEIFAVIKIGNSKKYYYHNRSFWFKIQDISLDTLFLELMDKSINRKEGGA